MIVAEDHPTVVAAAGHMIKALGYDIRSGRAIKYLHAHLTKYRSQDLTLDFIVQQAVAAELGLKRASPAATA